MNRRVALLVICLAATCFRATAQDPTDQPTNPAAQVRLGNTYLDQKDYASAMTWFRKAAEQGNVVGQNNIGWLYQNGWGVQQNYAEAVTWYRKAADQGYATAQGNLGWLYQKGFGIKQDYVEAMTWYRKAANQADAESEDNIGWLYEKGFGVGQDLAEAMSWYRKAADKGNASAQRNLGVLYEKGRGVKQDYAEAMTWYREAASHGNADAQNNIGMLYETGLGVERNYASAMAWFYLAADQGNAKAQGNIGWLCENGFGVEQDYAKAMTWYRKAAAQDEGQSQNNIGWLYEKGLGVSQDYAQAMAWFRKAADQGNADGQNSIGWLFQNGWGVKQDYAEAMTWYRKAAEQGNARAKANIDTLSRNGSQADQTHGTAQNNAAAGSSSEKESAPAILMTNGIYAPRAIYDPEPEYSEEARKAGTIGTVLMSLVVDPDGQPRDIKVVVPLGNGLDEKAVETVKTWKFEPATKEGKPVAVQIMVQVDFRFYGLSGVGKVEIVDESHGADSVSYLAPIVLEASQCWSKATEDKTHAPSLKQGQVTVQFAIVAEGRIGAIQIASPSGDEVLDRDAHDCVSSLKIDKPLPAELNGNDLVVRMQLLYNLDGVSLNPVRAQLAAGGREQFYLELAGTLSKGADWSVAGIGCKDAACGTISSEGLYTAPDVLPNPPFVQVKGMLAGANPLAASAVVTLVEKH